jgi:hypothetical protein
MPKRPRRDEILAWLKKHPRVTRFVVIDDEDDELDQLPLFQPSAETGLTIEIVRGATKYLDGKTNQDMRSNRFERFCRTSSLLCRATRDSPMARSNWAWRGWK